MVDTAETPEATEKELTLTITLNLETNTISILGPINDKVVAYGMIEFARDAIFEHHRKMEVSKIVTVPGSRMLNFVRGKK